MNAADSDAISAVDRYSAWLSEAIAPFLRERGFSKARSTFHCRGPEGWGVIDFQKSQWGSRDDVRFYVNLAVALHRLLAVNGDDPAKPPPERRGNWRTRIAAAAPSTPESYTLNPSTDTRALTTAVTAAVIDRALPWIGERMTAPGFLTALRTDPNALIIRPPIDVITEVLGRDPTA